LLARPALVVEGDDILGGSRHVGDDEADARIEFARMIICGKPNVLDFACAFNFLDPTRIFSSPAVLGDLVFVGHTVDGVNGYSGTATIPAPATIRSSCSTSSVTWNDVRFVPATSTAPTDGAV
jgi:hypothetical protein